MTISGKRVLNLDKYLVGFEEGGDFYIVVQNLELYQNELVRYGLWNEFKGSNTVMPKPIKSVTKFNASGKWVVNKSAPREDREFEISYHVIDWHGNDHYGNSYYTKKCYKRDLILPPEVKLTKINNMIVSPLLKYTQENKELIQHIINLYLEIFGVCEIVIDNLVPNNIAKIERLSWEVLPKGDYPWQKAKLYLEEILNELPKRYRTLVSGRHEMITANTPDFMAIGEQGFWGYTIYGFSKKGVFVFESNRPNNATYVFKGNWRDASKLAKSEILKNNLQELRIVHNRNWNDAIKRILN